jgi:hypothetical protein
MEEIPNNQEKYAHKKHPTLHLIIAVVVIVIAALFVYMYSNDIELLDKTSDKKVFSEEEKFEILKSLSGDQDNSLSIEEKRKILEGVSENKPADAYEYSEEGKLQILRSLQE